MRMGTMIFVFDGTQHNEVWEGWSQQRPPGLFVRPHGVAAGGLRLPRQRLTKQD